MSEERAPAPAEADDLAQLDDELDLDLGEEPPEPEPDPGSNVREEPEPEARGPRTREERRIAALRQREREAASRARQYEDENRRLREQLYRPQPAAPDPYRQAQIEQQERERVAQLPFEEQARYHAQQTEQRLSWQLLEARREMGDHLDRQNFAAIKREEPAARRLESKVEELLVGMRARNLNPTREEVYGILLSREIREKARNQGDGQRRQGARRVESQRVSPGSPGSSVERPARGQKRPEDMTEAELLERIGDLRV